MEDIKGIVLIQLNVVKERLREKNITVDISDSVVDFLSSTGYVKEFGARPLKRAIQNYLVSPLAVQVIKEQDKKHFVITFDEKKGELLIE